MNIGIAVIIIVVCLILNGVLASAASDIAKDKGYEKKHWFHMCFWLGPIAYIIVAAMPDKNLQESLKAISIELTKENASNINNQRKAFNKTARHASEVTVADGARNSGTQNKTNQYEEDTIKQDTQNLKEAISAIKANGNVRKQVTFGLYPQTKTGTDKTWIEWQVLECDGHKALLISRYGLDAQPYNVNSDSTTWENCTLRTWLNSTFMNKAFTNAEQKSIVLTNVDNSNSQGYSEWNTDTENATNDKLFLLSYAEANKYFDVTSNDSDNVTARVEPTEYAIEQGASINSNNRTEDDQAAGSWWLRSTGIDEDFAADVYDDGALSNDLVSSGSYCVRPAMWIDLDSDIFQSEN